MIQLVGGGHAGSEAAYISSKMGGKLVITMNLQNIAQMSCNPAMGGVAKGKLLEKLTLWAEEVPLFQTYRLFNSKC